MVNCLCGKSVVSFVALSQHARRCELADREFLFWVKVDKSPRPDGCWIWLGARSLSRYGTFVWENGSRINAHRAAWIFTNGQIPDGMDALHRCNNGHLGCVRPDHLYLGTDKENTRDKIAAGWNPRTDSSRLAPEMVRAIRELKGKRSSSETGHEFGISYRQVAKIWARHSYKDVP